MCVNFGDEKRVYKNRGQQKKKKSVITSMIVRKKNS